MARQKTLFSNDVTPHYFAGLFTADQKLKGTTAQYTRQNANGNRRGLEVPEERDYYPYWGPTPWNDIAIMVSNKETEKLMKDYVNSRDFYEKCKLLPVKNCTIVSDYEKTCRNNTYHCRALSY